MALTATQRNQVKSIRNKLLADAQARYGSSAELLGIEEIPVDGDGMPTKLPVRVHFPMTDADGDEVWRTKVVDAW